MKEAFIRPSTMRGTVLDLNVSKDREQRWLFVADGLSGADGSAARR